MHSVYDRRTLFRPLLVLLRCTHLLIVRWFTVCHGLSVSCGLSWLIVTWSHYTADESAIASEAAGAAAAALAAAQQALAEAQAAPSPGNDLCTLVVQYETSECFSSVELAS